MLLCGIHLKNKLIEQVLNDDEIHEKITKMFIIIDCTNNVLVDKYNFPQILTTDNKQTIKCHVILSINNKTAINFNDIDQIIKENNTILIRTNFINHDDIEQESEIIL